MRRKEFVRGQEPEIAMENGIFKVLGTWLNNTPPDSSRYIIKRDNEKKVITIDVDGDVVLKDFDIVNTDGIKGIYKIEFGTITGQITKLYELSTEEIYSRIKDYYKSILDKCISKTIEDQYEIIFGNETKGSNRPTERIEDREELIRNLPEVPTDEKLIETANEILLFNLEYTRSAKDKFSVEMSQYANEIIKRLKD